MRKFLVNLDQRGRIMGAKPRKYTAEFKEQAVRLAEEIGARKAAQKLGLSDANIHNWRAKKRAGEKFKGAIGTSHIAETPDEEIRRLRRENEELKKANYILKRAAAFFSQDHLK